MFKATVALACALVLTACAEAPARNEATLTYETTPEGATLYEGGKVIGVAPVSRSYPADSKGGQIRTPDVTAVWPSGAKTSFYTFLQVGDDRVATLERPAAAPNLQADLENAKKYKAASDQEKARIKEDQLREQAQMSARCREQMQGKGGVVDNCH